MDFCGKPSSLDLQLSENWLTQSVMNSGFQRSSLYLEVEPLITLLRRFGLTAKQRVWKFFTHHNQLLKRKTESAKVPFTAVMCDVLQFPFDANPFSSNATREFRFCIPDEWYRRSKSRSLSTSSLTPSEATIKRLADLEEDDRESDPDSEEGDGTAKQKDLASSSSTSSSPSKAGSGDWKGTFSQNRLSTIFDGWIPSSVAPSAVEAAPRERMSVSEPIFLNNTPVPPKKATWADGLSEAEVEDLTDFDSMLVGLQPLRSARVANVR